jgi:hypothetical protein
MSNSAASLADKLTSEGERILDYFRTLPEADWGRPIFEHGAQWTVRGVFEHLILSEASLLKLFANVLAGGPGATPEFDIDRFNLEHTGRLAVEGRERLLARYGETRRNTADFARGLSDAQLAMRGRHPAMGDSSVEDMLKLVYLHHSMHVRDVRRALTP